MLYRFVIMSNPLLYYIELTILNNDLKRVKDKIE